MTHVVGPVTDKIINSVINEFKKKENKEKLMKYVVDPLFIELYNKYYPYLIFIIAVIITIIVLLLSIILIIIFR